MTSSGIIVDAALFTAAVGEAPNGRLRLDISRFFQRLDVPDRLAFVFALSVPPQAPNDLRFELRMVDPDGIRVFTAVIGDESAIMPLDGWRYMQKVVGVPIALSKEGIYEMTLSFGGEALAMSRLPVIDVETGRKINNDHAERRL